MLRRRISGAVTAVVVVVGLLVVGAEEASGQKAPSGKPPPSEMICSIAQVMCGSRCVSRSEPAYGCGRCAPCALQNVEGPRCSAAGACDYERCAAGFVDQDGNRANGCERRAPQPPAAFVHQVTRQNSTAAGWITCIDHPSLNGFPDAVVTATMNLSAGGWNTLPRHTIVGVAYSERMGRDRELLPADRWCVELTGPRSSTSVGQYLNIVAFRP